jgi:hypothetical protein
MVVSFLNKDSDSKTCQSTGGYRGLAVLVILEKRRFAPLLDAGYWIKGAAHRYWMLDN